MPSWVSFSLSSTSFPQRPLLFVDFSSIKKKKKESFSSHWFCQGELSFLPPRTTSHPRHLIIRSAPTPFLLFDEAPAQLPFSQNATWKQFWSPAWKCPKSSGKLKFQTKSGHNLRLGGAKRGWISISKGSADVTAFWGWWAPAMWNGHDELDQLNSWLSVPSSSLLSLPFPWDYLLKHMGISCTRKQESLYLLL